jgi:hypothetical protein
MTEQREPADIEVSVHAALDELNALSEPSKRDATGLSQLAQEFASDLPGDLAILSVVLQEVVRRHPEPVPMADVEQILDRSPTDQGGRIPMDAVINQINRRLADYAINQLPGYRVARLTRNDAGARLEPDFLLALTSTDIESLVSRHPSEITMIHPSLRVAWGLYDAGDYMMSAKHFVVLASEIGKGLSLTREEITLFFYYFSKCLLKLNLYESLERCIDGPYERFSRRRFLDLETERLQIAGVLHRHRGDLVLAQTCLDAAVEQLSSDFDDATVSSASLRYLADAEVLRIHPRLDQAVRPGGRLVRTASLRLAEQGLERARRWYGEYWRRAGEPTHYEGRLGGTAAYVAIARSLVDPPSMTTLKWDDAKRDARFGFEPEHGRKPVGVLAGRVCLATVCLAEARWLHETQTSGSALGVIV